MCVHAQISFVELKKKLTKRKGDLLARQWNSARALFLPRASHALLPH